MANQYVISKGAQGKLFTLRVRYVDHNKNLRDDYLITLTGDLESSKLKATKRLGHSNFIVEEDNVSPITRRSDVDWFNEPLDFGKYAGETPKDIAQNDYRYFLWVAANGSQKWQKIFKDMMELPEYSVLKEKFEANFPENIKAKFATENPDVVAFLEKYKVDSDYEAQNFFQRLYLSYSRGQEIKSGAIAIIRDKIKEESSGVVSQHVGKVGKRQEFLVEVKSVREYWTEGFGYNAGQIRNYATTMKDKQGNVVVYMGTKKLGGVGEILKLAGTVKSHDQWQGVKQTKISRPNVLGVVSESEVA